ncbi:NUDIX hydrolase [Isoptericola variabilis]|uniref:NUDIX hydrolase n=1 Tax=Isoptericola variabilis (strain 225) TaxID=743718 RepID=F6FT58_ISOV2|nr:NUDIX hydrolase [Isoptericola variabilis]AEG44129.1 NUDIX hydrolase [Isoptericola variabilis 225]
MTQAAPGRTADEVDPRPVVRHERLHAGRVFDLVRDDVDLGAAGTVTREYLDHPGAVAIVALDDADRVLLLRQYRHPVRGFLWEVPAGLLDVDGEHPQAAAARELAEEADLTAARWDVLVDFATSPGASNESLRVFLARDLGRVPEHERHVRTGEEADMVERWVPLEEAVALVLDGSLHNPSAVVGILAAAASRAGGWASLRPVDAPWPYRRGALPA